MCKEEQCHLFTKLLAACSAGVINRRYDIGPGIVWDDVVPVVSPDSSMKHVLFLSPMVWELDDYEFDDCLVKFLSVVPISDEEKAFILQNDMDAFLELLAEKGGGFRRYVPTLCVLIPRCQSENGQGHGLLMETVALIYIRLPYEIGSMPPSPFFLRHKRNRRVPARPFQRL